jgi:hypothetical protein
MESTPIQYQANAESESGIAKAKFLLEEITKKLNRDHPGFTTTATQQTQRGQGRNVTNFGIVIDIITKAIQTKIMQVKDVSEWDSRYYDDISTAIPTYGVLDSIIEELEQDQTIKYIIRKAKENQPEVLVTSVTLHGDQNAGRKMRKSRYRHRKSNKKHRKGNKKHKKSIKKHRK